MVGYDDYGSKVNSNFHYFGIVDVVPDRFGHGLTHLLKVYRGVTTADGSFSASDVCVLVLESSRYTMASDLYRCGYRITDILISYV